MSNASAFAALDDHIMRVATLPIALDGDGMQKLAGSVDEEVRRQILAGQDPSGQPWQPTRAGGRPLVGAQASVGVAAVGRRVVIRAWGHIARHSLGRAKGGIERQVVPRGAIPQGLAQVLKDKVRTLLREHMGSP